MDRRRAWWAACLTFICLSLAVLHVGAKEAAPAASDPALEARMQKIAEGLRCLVCQNQTIADSHADLAADLRQEIREMLQQGKTDQDIQTYMTDRYGDFILYKPPVKSSTLLLWFGPGALLVLGLISLFVILRRRAQLPDQAFDADDDQELAASDSN